MTAERVAHDLPSPPVLLNWHTPWMGRQHAFDRFRSLCGRLRWTARLEVDRTAPFCPDCVTLARAAVAKVLDYIVDAEADAAWEAWDLKKRTLDAGQLADVSELEMRALDGDR